MKVTVLTSSRADFGIQLPLLAAMRDDPAIELSLVAFGAHADRRLGYTLNEVVASGYPPTHVMEPVLVKDDAEGISSAMGLTMQQFARHWRPHRPDMVVALGDRYEMFAAVAAALPFGIPVAHLHGGETTMGAIDNALRHSITHMSAVHCCSAAPYAERVKQLIGSDRHVHVTGALSIDNLRSMHFMSTQELRERFGADLDRPTILITFHPETAGHRDDQEQWNELEAALRDLAGRYQLLITMPNADTHGFAMRERWQRLIASERNAVGVDSMGARGYLSAMKHCAFVLGNSSSGYVEASFFPKAVIDLGERQTGRMVTPHIMRCAVNSSAILDAVSRIEREGIPPFSPPYGDGHAAQRIVAAIKDHFG
jgi:GDP/UDP-N,N'-diacetylbacillosamine 2-epimerase (hydrolysing)